MKNIDDSVGVFLGPTYFENIATKVESPKHLENIEWRARINFKCNQIKFYGDLHVFEKSKQILIASTDFAPQRIIAVNTVGREVLLFDGCKHGYNAMFCDEYSSEQIENRPLNKILFEGDEEEFEIFLSAYYQTGFDETFFDEIDENGMFTLKDGSSITYLDLKRNGFDVFEIFIKDKMGKTYSILEEELA
jgi:hypothetical protein